MEQDLQSQEKRSWNQIPEKNEYKSSLQMVVHGGFGYGSRNQEGEGILNFALAYDLFVTNTLFRKSLSPSNF
jgi:hypothetical protein